MPILDSNGEIIEYISARKDEYESAQTQIIPPEIVRQTTQPCPATNRLYRDCETDRKSVV